VIAQRRAGETMPWWRQTFQTSAGVVVAHIGRMQPLAQIAGRLRQSLKETVINAEAKLIKAQPQAFGILRGSTCAAVS